MWWYPLIVQPGPLLSMSAVVSAKTSGDSGQKEEDLFVSQHSRKPHVMR